MGEDAKKGNSMAVAKIIELTSRSSTSFDDAVAKGIAKAGESVHDMQTAWVKDQQVILDNDKVSDYQVTLKITFLVK
jgi:flavin-binding protein dodecin